MACKNGKCNIKVGEDAIRQMDRWLKRHQLQPLDEEQEEAMLKAIFGKEAKRVSKNEVMKEFKK